MSQEIRLTEKQINRFKRLTRHVRDEAELAQHLVEWKKAIADGHNPRIIYRNGLKGKRHDS